MVFYLKFQSMGQLATVNIDKTDGCQVYLSNDSKFANIITAKSSEVNLLVPNDNMEFVCSFYFTDHSFYFPAQCARLLNCDCSVSCWVRYTWILEAPFLRFASTAIYYLLLASPFFPNGILAALMLWNWFFSPRSSYIFAHIKSIQYQMAYAAHWFVKCPTSTLSGTFLARSSHEAIGSTFLSLFILLQQ